MGPSILIREAKDEDAQEFCALRIQAWHESYQDIIDSKTLESLDLEEDIARYRAASLTNPQNQVSRYVAVIEDKIAGFIIVGPERIKPSPSKGEVYALYVLHEFKGQGIGKALWQHGTQILLKRDLTPFGVWVFKENKEARKFYAAIGGHLSFERTIDIEDHPHKEVRYDFNMP